MKKTVISAAAATIAAASLAVAAPAHADSTNGTIAAINAAAQFSVDATNAGFYNADGPQAQLLIGITACNNLDAGYTPAGVTMGLTQTTYMDAYHSGQFVRLATQDLCPWHFGQGYLVSMSYGTGSGTGQVV